jgi:hypothetical protein
LFLKSLNAFIIGNRYKRDVPISIKMDDTTIERLSELYKKYESNEYMLNRLSVHLLTILPNTLDLEYENYKERVSRTLSLQTMQETFIKVFLSKYKYYYLYASGFYYEYVDDSFCIRKEDDIHYKLLSTISEDRTLMDWKYKTKFNIIRQIKDRNVLLVTPNTATIQRVLNAIYPAFFPSKNAAKYFMTVIGDNILKKQTPVRIIHKHSSIFAGIDYIAHLIGASNLTNNFASKYNDNHIYSQYRLLQANVQFPSTDTWRNIITHLNLDLLCVASHYSNRYGSSEGFLEHSADECLKNHILYLNTQSQETIIAKFIEHSTQHATDSSFKITWKQLHYIWKQYLNGESIPNMIYSNALKQNLKHRLQYDEATDSFINLTSKYLPNIRHFLNFCEENLIMSQTTPDELELGELYILYASPIMKECELLKLVKHFFPEIIIDEYKYNKYILRTQCKLWNKTEGILNVINHYKESPKSDIISIDDLYVEYIALTSGKLVVSKQYFEKYVRNNLKEFIVYETFIDFTTTTKTI